MLLTKYWPYAVPREDFSICCYRWPGVLLNVLIYDLLNIVWKYWHVLAYDVCWLEVQLLLLQVLPLPSPRFQAGREDHSLKHLSWFTGIFSKTAVMDRGWYFLRFDILSYLTWWALAWCYLADICQNIWCHCLLLVVPCCFYGCCLNDINILILSCGCIVLLC